jgi:short-subunit dehydrogenase
MRRTALITGGGSGIGRGIALALARRDVDVALVARRPAPLEAVAHEAAALGVRSVALPADLADGDERAILLPRARSALGPIDILVHSAGVLAGGDLATLAPDEIERAVAVNLLAPIALTRLALPDLAARRGALVLVASTTSLVPLPSAAVYAATKAGLSAFGAALRYELEPLGVRLLVAYPPSADTAMVRGMADAAGMPGYHLAPPALVGERIVAALAAGRRELLWGAGERTLVLAYRLAPWLIRLILRTQRRRFARMMSASGRR